MQSITLINRLLNDIAIRHGVSNLQLGLNGTVAVKLQDGVELVIEYVQQSDQLFIYTEVGTLPDAHEERGYLCERLLEMNCLGRDTVYGTLSLDSHCNTVLYQIGLPVADLTVNRLDQALQHLLTQRQAMIDSIKSTDAPAASDFSSRSASLSMPAHVARLFQKGVEA